MQTYILTLAFLYFLLVELEHVISNLGYHLEQGHPSRVTDSYAHSNCLNTFKKYMYSSKVLELVIEEV